MGGVGEEARGRGAGAAERAPRGKERGGGEEDLGGRGGPRRALFLSLSVALPLPASPSLSSQSGLGAPDAASQPPAGAGGEATAKVSANFTAWRDLGGEAR